MVTVSKSAATAREPAASRSADSPLTSSIFEMKSAWVAVFVFSMTINFLMLAPVVYMMQVSDRVMTSRNMTTLLMLSLLALAAFAVMGLLESARSRVMVRLGVRLDRRIGPRLLALSHRFEVEKLADGRRLLSDLTHLRGFLTGQAIFAVLDAPWVPIFIIVAVMLHPTLAMVFIGGAVVMAILAYVTERAVRKPLADSNNSAAETYQFTATNMRHGEIIEAMGMFPMMLERWQKKQDRHLAQQAIASDRAGILQGITKFVRMANQAISMGVGSLLFLSSTDVSPAIVFAAMVLAGRITQPIEALTASWSQFGTVVGCWRRLDDALRFADKQYSGVTLPPPKGDVALEGVFGGPPGVSAPFVQNVSLKIPAGVIVAVVGSSASGKSTLIRLITGVWAPRVGTVRLDGADLRTWRREQLGPHIGYVPQDVELIEGTVAENIARLGAIDSDRIIAAARAAGVHEMVLEMADGYGTQVGANGAFLSGGQRQRIALARAMYGDPALLVLDEPNANLDEAGELALDLALQQAKQRGQTVIIVSHRPIAIRNCDLILVMQDGQVLLYGPREQVMTKLAAAAAAAKA